MELLWRTCLTANVQAGAILRPKQTSRRASGHLGLASKAFGGSSGHRTGTERFCGEVFSPEGRIAVATTLRFALRCQAAGTQPDARRSVSRPFLGGSN